LRREKTKLGLIMAGKPKKKTTIPESKFDISLPMKKREKQEKTPSRPKRKISPLHKPATKKEAFDPPFFPTEQMCDDVKTMAALGMPEKAISILVRNPNTGKSIDIDTLRKHFEQEILIGAANSYRSTLMNLFRMAQSSEINGTVLSAIESFLKRIERRFQNDDEKNSAQQSAASVTVNIDNRSQIAFTKEELMKIPVEDLRRLNEIRATLSTGTEGTL
jgi:hypothetical protein